MKYNSRYKIEDGAFVKFIPDQFNESVEKYKCLYRTALKNKFIAPKLLSYDYNTVAAKFKYIDGLVSIREEYIKLMVSPELDESKLNLFYKVGTVLGSIHCDMVLDVKRYWEQPTQIQEVTRKWLNKEINQDLCATPHTFIHGDYGFPNINTIGSNGQIQLVVIDPCPNYYYTFHVNSYASVYIDLATLISCLDGRVSLKHYKTIQWDRLNHIKNAFIDGYQARTGYKINRFLLASLTCAVTESYFIRKYGKGVRSFIAHKIIHNIGKKNIPESYYCS